MNLDEAQVIVVLAKANPHAPGTAAALAFADYRDGITVGEWRALQPTGHRKGYLQPHLRAGYIALRPGAASSTNRCAERAASTQSPATYGPPVEVHAAPRRRETAAPAFLHIEWASDLEAGGVRGVFVHLAQHGSITEDEAIHLLGSPRAFRRFALEFELHAEKVPFRVRIEGAQDGKRYVKEGDK